MLIPMNAHPQHALLADYQSLTDVRLRSHLEVERGLFMAESFNVIERALDAGAQPRSYMMSEKWLPKFEPLFSRHPDVPVFVGTEKELESVTGFHVHRGALASMQRPPLAPVEQVLENARTLAIIEDVVDHTNVGAMFRSAAALRVDGILVTPRAADPLYRRSIRVSMGAVFQVPWTRLAAWPDDMRRVREHGFDIAALALHDSSIPLHEANVGPERKLAFVFGPEGHGLSARTLAAADESIVIPMSAGVDSLNVAAASAVVFWHRFVSCSAV